MPRFFTFASIFVLLFSACSVPPQPLTAPKLTNNPSLDIIATNRRPLLSFFNAKGGYGARTYTIQLDTVSTFDSENIIEYKEVPEENQYISSKLVDEKDALKDGSRYYWRVRAVDSSGRQGPWAQSRFYIDTKADDAFMKLVRIPVKDLEVSGSFNKKNIIDLDDPGQVSFWQSTPPGSDIQWVKFDLGKNWEVSRIWILSNPKGPNGWLKNFIWQMSSDGENWTDIMGTEVKNNNTFRNIIDFPAVTARYLRLMINEWHGYAPQINAITLYSPGMPPVPTPPEGNYVLIVGNQMNGFTFTKLADFVEGLDLGLKTLVVPHYEVSLDMVEKLPNKPVAIILSGNDANYPNLPMFEYNGEYELIRGSDIPILGICCGHQQLVMAYGYTYARSMGWTDITALDSPREMTKIKIIKDDPIFEGIPNPFVGTEIHGWADAESSHGWGVVTDEYELLAASTYTQAIKSKTKMIYGEQFHAEIKVPYNQGTPYLVNFLKLAMEKTGAIKHEIIQE